MDVRQTIGVLLLLLVLVQVGWASDGLMTVRFFDVGTADSALFTTPAGEHILIDGGTREGGKKIANFLKAHGIGSLDVVIATHPHPDHIGGLAQVLREFKVQTLFDTGMQFECPEYTAFHDALSNLTGVLVTVCGRMVVTLPSGVRLEFLNPKRPAEDIHTDCIVVRICYKSVAVLMMGDANTTTEGVLLFDEVPLKSDILKVAHHGASDSTSEAFLKSVAPRFAVISVGTPNQYGRPHKVVLDRLNRLGVAVYRTDQCGDITFITDGKSVAPPQCERQVRANTPRRGSVLKHRQEGNK